MMKKVKKILAGVIIVQAIGITSIASASEYTVQSGDTFWKISNKLNISVTELMNANSAKEGSLIYVGQNIKLPQSKALQQNPKTSQITKKEATNNQSSQIYSYTVEPGDGLWAISNKVGMNFNNLLELNKLDSNSMIHIGQILKIDKEYKPLENNSFIKDILINSNDKQNIAYGTPLDWFNEVQYIIPIGKDFKVTDLKTQKTFNLRRTYGVNHADVEALTARDTETIKEIWGEFSWSRRAVIVEVEGIRIAASLAAMPHAGNDDDPANVHTAWRSENYGPGINLDAIKGNNMHGHLDLHFLNSKGHANPVLNAEHQKCVKQAAGI